MLVKSMKIFSLIMVIIITISSFVYVYIGWDDIPFDSTIKSTAPGKYAKLTDGDIHYQWFEPKSNKANGEIVVMSHGYAIPGFMFNQTAIMLTDAGYKVLVFDHFGHGFSDRPKGPYNSDFFERELLELLDSLKIYSPVIMVGQSMGGLIASNFTANHPKRIKKLALFVPAGLRMVESENKELVDLLGVPVIGPWIFRIVGRASMLEKKERPCKTCGDGKIDGDIYHQADFEGYFESMKDILVEFPMTGQDHIYKKLGKVEIPMYAIFADKDELVKLESAELFNILVPHAKISIVKNSDHAVHVRQWEKVGKLLIDWLSTNQLHGLSEI
ncbi:MAG: hypothetical protein COB38_09620 [Gammaproteobacteria bacterium]|nr:MAG: hypothetical protein COB38_09620 [Gammaproteobacteria bacterium]